MPETFGKSLASWHVQEFEKHARSVEWYIMFGAIALLLLVIAFVSANFLFAIIILITSFIFFLQSRSEPLRIKFQITSKGIKIGEKEHPYKELKNFWILYNPPHVKKLYFSFNNALTPRFMVPLKGQNPLKIREILLDYLQEDVSMEDEPISEVFGRVTKI